MTSKREIELRRKRDAAILENMYLHSQRWEASQVLKEIEKYPHPAELVDKLREILKPMYGIPNPEGSKQLMLNWILEKAESCGCGPECGSIKRCFILDLQKCLEEKNALDVDETTRGKKE